MSELQLNLSLLGLGGGSITWARTDGDRSIARSVVTFLEDRRLLFGERHIEDEMQCIVSANEIRTFITQKIMEPQLGNQLEDCLRVIRRLARDFIDAAGYNGENFQHRDMVSTDPFSLALGELRKGVGAQLAVLTTVYELEVEFPLSDMLPRPERDDEGEADYSWIPGFSQRA